MLDVSVALVKEGDPPLSSWVRECLHRCGGGASNANLVDEEINAVVDWYISINLICIATFFVKNFSTIIYWLS